MLDMYRSSYDFDFLSVVRIGEAIFRYGFDSLSRNASSF